MKDEDIPVSDSGQLSVAGGRRRYETRRLGEFSKTNSPLSDAEIAERRKFPRNKETSEREWKPRTLKDVHEIAPEPEHAATRDRS